MFQSISIGSGVLIGLIALQASHPISGCLWVLLFLFGVSLFCVALICIDRDVFYASRHLRRLEAEVNEMAGTTILRWESAHGLGGLLWKFLLQYGIVKEHP